MWQELWSLLDVKLGMSTAFHPATDGQTEVLNRILEDLIRTHCHSNQADWLKALPLCEFYYNNSVSSTTGLAKIVNFSISGSFCGATFHDQSIKK